jgi:hypothetical protein
MGNTCLKGLLFPGGTVKLRDPISEISQITKALAMGKAAL